MTDSDTDRTLGVEFGDLGNDFESESYPVEKGEIVSEYGDRTLGLEEENTTVRDVLEPQGEVTYESALDVKRGILNMVGNDALSRERYSDRSGEAQGVDADEHSI